MEHLVGLEGLTALFILLPGFLCARLIQWLCVRPKQSELDKIVESLLYSFIIYLIFGLVHGGSVPVAFVSQQVQGATRYGVQFDHRSLFELAGIALVLAFGVGGIVTNDLSGRVFRKLRLTQRTTRSSVWSDAFHDASGVVQVELGDGRTIMGWLRYYSDEPKDASLFLEKAAWIGPDQSLVRIPGPGILVTKELGINSVSFLDRDDTRDSKATFGGKKMFKGWIVFLVAAILIAAGISAGIRFWSDASKVQAVANLAGFVATVLLLSLTAVYVGTNQETLSLLTKQWDEQHRVILQHGLDAPNGNGHAWLTNQGAHHVLITKILVERESGTMTALPEHRIVQPGSVETFTLPPEIWQYSKPTCDVDIAFEYEHLGTSGKTEPKAFNLMPSSQRATILSRIKPGIHGLWDVNCPKCGAWEGMCMKTDGLENLVAARGRKRAMQEELRNSCPSHQSSWMLTAENSSPQESASGS
jgi:hypothetical protein